jgi:hypothetical protein
MTPCRNNGINLNPKKCAFCVNSGVLLGHIVCEDGLLVDPRKTNIITYMPTLMNVTKLNFFFRGSRFLLMIFQEFCC